VDSPLLGPLPVTGLVKIDDVEADCDGIPSLYVSDTVADAETASGLLPDREQLDTDAFARAGPAVIATWP
jgi:hypothetical protein